MCYMEQMERKKRHACVESVRDCIWFVFDAIARGLGWSEFGLVSVCRLVEVDVARPPLDAQRSDQTHQRGCLFSVGFGGLRTKRAVRVDRRSVPALDVLVPPGAHTGRDQNVHLARVRRRRLTQPQEGALDARGFVAMHSAGEQNTKNKNTM